LSNENQLVISNKELATTQVESHLDIYTDGSYDSKTGVYGGALIVLFKNMAPAELKVAGADPKFSASANVAGELLAAMQAIRLALVAKATSLTIYYDYLGIEKWTLPVGNNAGGWRTKMDLSKAYLAYYQEALKLGLKISFVHVKGHSGNVYNDRADILAREAVKECIKSLATS